MAPLPWPDYFAIPGNEGLIVPNPLQTQLDERSPRVFAEAEEEEESNMQVIDITRDGLRHTVVRDEQAFDSITGDAEPRDGIRILSICCGGSILPLDITSSLTEIVFSYYKVQPAFLRTLLCFGDPIHVSQSSITNYFHSMDEDGSYVLTYKVNCIECNDRSPASPWSNRQIGVYHQHTHSGDLFILLCSSENSVFPASLNKLALSSPSSEPRAAKQLDRLFHQPGRLHVELFQSYSDNWGPYFRYIGVRFERILNEQMGSRTDKIAPETDKQIQSLRNLLDRLRFSTTCCQSMAGLCQNLSLLECLNTTDKRSFRTQSSVLEEFVLSSRSLESRILNIISMTVDTLGFHNYLEGARLDREMKDLTQEMKENVAETRGLTRGVKELAEKTASDGVVIRVVTIVTAVYLPGSFVASVFGMNFFDFSNDERSIVIASDFWIFVLAWVISSIVTAFVFFFFTRTQAFFFRKKISSADPRV